MLEGREKWTVAKSLFENTYSKRFESRAINFADALKEADVTVHQLRRFFLMHGTPAKAKEHLPDLTSFEEQAAELLHDEVRAAESCDALRFGAERLRDLILESYPPSEGDEAAGEAEEDLALQGPGMQTSHSFLIAVLHQAAHANAQKTVADIKNRRRERIHTYGNTASLKGPGRDASNPMVDCVENSYKVMRRLLEISRAAKVLQGRWRNYAGKQFMQAARSAVAVARITKEYMADQTTNHVLKIWEEDRRKEKENMSDFIAKKREMFLVQMSLDTKRAEIRKLEERAQQRDEVRDSVM